MALSDDKTTLNFVLDKSLKYKLQVLADADEKKIGAYVATVLEEHIKDFEARIVEVYGADDFVKEYEAIFGNEYHPHFVLQPDRTTYDEEDAKKKINAIKSGAPRDTGRSPGNLQNIFDDKQYMMKMALLGEILYKNDYTSLSDIMEQLGLKLKNKNKEEPSD